MYNDAVPWVNKAKSCMFRRTVSFLKKIEIQLHFFCQPALLCSARCTTPEISDRQGNDGGFTNLLF